MITASIVTFHTELVDIHLILECIINSPVEIIYIIDNSLNDSLRELTQLSDKVLYIHNANLGYGSGHNIALEKAITQKAKYHIIINPDIYFDRGVIEKLIDFMEQTTDCGFVMPKVLYPTGETQYLCKLLPTPWDLLGRRFISWNSFNSKRNTKYELRFTGYENIMDVPSLSGCFMFLRVDVLKKTGGFDERYFMYAEDLDLCRRIGEISRTVFYPKVSIYHKYDKGSYRRRKLLKYHIFSVIKYFNKWGWFFDLHRKRINEECLNKLQYK